MVLTDAAQEIKKFIAEIKQPKYVMFEEDGFWYMVPEGNKSKTTVLMHTEKEGHC